MARVNNNGDFDYFDNYDKRSKRKSKKNTVMYNEKKHKEINRRNARINKMWCKEM